MFKRITLICFVGLLSISAKAQFMIEGDTLDDTLYAFGYAGTTSGEFAEIAVAAHIKHTGSNTEIIKWERTVNQLPGPKWSSAVCDILFCRAAEVDTGSFVFGQGDSGEMSFHFYTDNLNGDGKMVVRFYRASAPLEYEDVIIMGKAWKPVGIHPVNASVTRVMPNPSKDAVTLTNQTIDNGSLELYNAMGQLVLSADYSNNMSFDISSLSAGIYTVKIFDASGTSVSKIIKE